MSKSGVGATLGWFLFLLTTGLLCASCSSTPSGSSITVSASGVTTAPAPPPPPTDPLAKLAAFSITDLQSATADAKAQTPPDTTASQCWDFLIVTIPKLQSQFPQFGTLTPGAFTLFQKARDLQNGLTNPTGSGAGLKSLNLACAPLVIDTQTVINKLLLMAAGTAAGGGAASPLLGGLSAIGPSLPIPLP